MALPKRKHSKARRDKRRSHDALKPVQTISCDNCGEQKLPHKVCGECGFYKGKKVADVKAKVTE